MRALIYARVSLDRGGRSTTEQADECRAWAAREGWTVVKTITETGSASRYARSTGARRRWGEVIDALTSGTIDILITWEASRATRDLSAYAELRELCAAHGVRWGYSGAVHDLTTRDARFRTGLDALLAEDESARTSERIRRSVRARAAQGRPHGKIPYGYRREYDSTTGALVRQVPDETTAPIVREIVARVAAGETHWSIASDLTRRGVPIPRPARTPRNGGQGAWLPTTTTRIARSRTNLGERIHRGEVVGPAAWPAIVDRDTFGRAQAVMSARANTNPTGDQRARWLLTGIAVCGVCGGPMHRFSPRGRPTYACAWGACTARLVAPTDAHVATETLALLSGIHITDTDTTEVESARDDLAALERRLDDIVDAAAQGSVSAASLAKIEAKLTPQIAAARRRVEQLLVPGLSRWDLSDPGALWDSLDVAGRRELLRATVTVTIYPVGKGRRRFDPTAVEVAPRW